MKRFWRFIKHSRTDSTGIAELKTEGVTVSDPTGKAKALNNQFKSAFTTETQVPPNILPDTSLYEDMADIDFTVQGVEKIISKL